MRQLFLFAIICAPAWACSCGGYPSVKGAWLDSPLVFVGFVDKTDPPRIGGRLMSVEQTAWVRVMEPFKGVRTGEVLELRHLLSSCSGGLDEGTTLLFYLYPGQHKGTWAVRPCHRSGSVDNAADDLKFLRGLPASARGNRVSGTVALWEHDFVKELPMRRGFGGVRVRAVAASGSYETVTDAQGLYEFRDLPPSTYAIRIDYPKGTILRFAFAAGLLRRAISQKESDLELDVTDESSNGFNFILAPDTRITGRVLGPDGGPLKGVCLDIEPLEGSSHNPSPIFACTKPDGSYVLHRMPAGSYRIVTNRNGQMTAAAPFGRLYYPGTPDINKAGVLTIAAGQHLDGIDLRVSELAGRIELRGRLTFGNGEPLADQSLDFRGNDGRYQEYGRTDGNGNFVMQILAGRPGTLTSEVFVWGDLARSCPQFKVDPAKGVLKSMPVGVAGDKDLSGMEVVFPFPPCDAWMKKQAERKRL